MSVATLSVGAAFLNDLDWTHIATLCVDSVHIVGCILLIVSIWVQKSLLVIGFLITFIIFMITYLVQSILIMVEGQTVLGLLMILLILLFIYFWICAFSWFIELREFEEEN
ncbi:hypothetical protein ACLKA6_002469 [Drosophila palustris]